jgi:hypothetical protein
MTTTERKPHPHAEVIKAYADGYDSGRSEGYDVGYEDGVAASAPE